MGSVASTAALDVVSGAALAARLSASAAWRELRLLDVGMRLVAFFGRSVRTQKVMVTDVNGVWTSRDFGAGVWCALEAPRRERLSTECVWKV